MRTRRLALFTHALTVLVIVVGAPPALAAPTEIEVWHTMKGAAATTFVDLVTRFNSEQSDVRVHPQYKGEEAETVAAGIDAARLKKAPHLLQVSDEQSGVLWTAGVARPLFEVLPLAKSPDFNFFLPGTVSFMKNAQGQLYGFPLKASVPVLFYNKEAYRKVGLDPEVPPRTWRELQVHLLALKTPGSGINCAYTTSDQAWIHIENLGTWHGEAIATRNNGLDGPGATLTFNGLLHVRHTALMMSWVKAEIFSYSGRHKQGDARFLSGECATLSSASNALGDLRAGAGFEFGIAPMPYHEEGARQPVNTLVGGSSLWVMGGKSQAEYTAVAKFLAYFATPVIAARWHQETGNLPLTQAAYLASEKTGFYQSVSGLGPIMKAAATSVGSVTRGIRLPNYHRVRDVMDTQLEAVWDGSKAAKLALDDAVRLGNTVMREGAARGTPPALVPTKARPASRPQRPAK